MPSACRAGAGDAGGKRTSRDSPIRWAACCHDDPRWLGLAHRNWSPGQRPGQKPGVPNLVELAGRLAPAERGNYLYVVGFIVMCSGAHGQVPHGLPDDIAADYREALPKALALITSQLTTEQTLMDTRYLLAATAALKGFPEFGEFLNNLDASLQCQACGETVDGIPAGLA